MWVLWLINSRSNRDLCFKVTSECCICVKWSDTNWHTSKWLTPVITRWVSYTWITPVMCFATKNLKINGVGVLWSQELLQPPLCSINSIPYKRMTSRFQKLTKKFSKNLISSLLSVSVAYLRMASSIFLAFWK